MDVDMQEDSTDDFACEKSQAPLGWSVSFSRSSCHKLRPLRRRNKSNSDLEMTPTAVGLLKRRNKSNSDFDLTFESSKLEDPCNSCLDTTAGETSASDHSDSADEAKDGSPPQHVGERFELTPTTGFASSKFDIPCNSCLDTTAGETSASDHSESADETKDGSPPQHVGEAATSENDEKKLASLPSADSSQTEAKRKIVFRDIIVKLREETQEAQQAAIVAEKIAQEAQKRVTSFEDSQSAQRKRFLMQSERQRSADQRKKRNQAAYLQGVQAKADQALLEANAIKDKAEMEAAEIRARAVANAQEDVSARKQSLQQEEDELQRQALENATRINAEMEFQAQAVLTQAKRCADELKQQASVEAELRAELLVQSAKSRALEEADAVKASALKHALGLRAKVEEQVQAKLEAAKQAEATAQAAAASAAATAQKVAADKLEAERQSRLQTAATMKEAKVREQQDAKKQQRLVAQQRNHAAHLQSVQEKAEKALHEANTIRDTAENDVAEIRAQAVVEAQAAAAAEKQALLHAHAELAELRNEAAKALEEAKTIRSKAESDVAEIRAQAVVEAQTAVENQALLDACDEVADMHNEAVCAEAAHENVTDQDSEDWELLPNMSIEQCLDTTWDVVVV